MPVKAVGKIYVPIHLGNWGTVPQVAFLSREAAERNIKADLFPDETPKEKVYEITVFDG